MFLFAFMGLFKKKEMKNQVFVFFYFFPMLLNAQVADIRITDMAGDEYTAYVKSNNKITAFIENESCDSFYLTTNNGKIWKDTTRRCHYIFRPENFNTTFIYFNQIMNGDTSILKQQKIRLRPFPFTTRVNRKGLFKGKFFFMKLEELKDIRVTVESWNTGLSARLPIREFDLVIIRKGKNILEKSYLGFNRAIKDKVEQDLKICKPHDLIVFKNIKYNYMGYTEEATDIYVYVKD
jgi:hypothetical protein